MGVLAVPLAVASLAFACARLATLKLDRESAAPGATVNAVGINFNSDAASSPVALRFNSRNGRVLWQGRPDRSGRVRASFAVPQAATGQYVILATQQTAEGRPAAGTPGRAPLRVRGAAARSASGGAGAGAAGGTGPAPGGGPPDAALVPLLLLALAGGAGTLVLTTRRRATAPAPRAH